MKKFVLLIAFVLLVACSVTAVYAVGLPDDPTEYAMDGISVSSENFADVFSGNPNARTVIQEDALSDSELLLTDIVVNNENVSINANLTINDSLVVLPISGSLGAGYKTQTGINSAVVQVYEPVNGYEILLFEIFNDTADDNLLLDYAGVGSNYSGVPHIKLYIKNASGTIFLFESSLPDEFDEIVATDYDTADKRKDALWALPFVNVTSNQIASDIESTDIIEEEVQPYGLGYFETISPGVSYTSSYYLGLSYYEHLSTPKLRYKHTNVNSNDSTWTYSFMITEYTRITNTDTGTSETYYGTNPVEYSNLKVDMGCGRNTTFIRSYQEGKMYSRNWFNGMSVKDIGDDITIFLLSKALSSYPSVMTTANVINNIMTALPEEMTVCLGSNTTKLYAERTVTVCESLEDYYFSACTSPVSSDVGGDYFTLQGVVQSEGANSTESTVGVFSVSCNVWNEATESEVTFERTTNLSYSVSP